MKIFICKNCGFFAETHSDEWKIKVTNEEDMSLQCPKCHGTKLFRMNILIEPAI